MADVLTFSASGRRIVLKGFMDERMDDAAMIKAVQSLPASDVIEINFKDVSLSSSAGIVQWIRFTHQLKNRFVYSDCPTWLVNNFNSITDFLPKAKCAATSVFVPYFCEEADEEIKVLFQIGSEIPIQSSYQDFKLPDHTKDGQLYTCDITPTKYFSFLAAHHQSFAEVLKAFKNQK